jgi:transposase InsO family protein
MRNNNDDKTLERNYLQKFIYLIKEYELIKENRHPKYKYVKDFFIEHDTCWKTFAKYYNRFRLSWKMKDLLPQKRGPKWKTRRPAPYIEQKVIELRERWNNKYEINSILKPKLKWLTPSPSWVYNICKRYNLNVLTPEMEKEKRKIVKTRLWELWHIDAHYLPKWIIRWDKTRYFLLSIMDDCSRIVYTEVIDNIKSLTIMFSWLRILNILSEHYWIKFEKILSDNWSEFWPRYSKNKVDHPFERMLIELWIEHKYIRPYRPQTNGKIERFWRTIEEDLIKESDFDTLNELREEVLQYNYYYNHERPHSSLWWKTPIEFAKNILPN